MLGSDVMEVVKTEGSRWLPDLLSELPQRDRTTRVYVGRAREEQSPLPAIRPGGHSAPHLNIIWQKLVWLVDRVRVIMPARWSLCVSTLQDMVGRVPETVHGNGKPDLGSCPGLPVGRGAVI